MCVCMFVGLEARQFLRTITESHLDNVFLQKKLNVWPKTVRSLKFLSSRKHFEILYMPPISTDARVSLMRLFSLKVIWKFRSQDFFIIFTNVLCFCTKLKSGLVAVLVKSTIKVPHYVISHTKAANVTSVPCNDTASRSIAGPDVRRLHSCDYISRWVAIISRQFSMWSDPRLQGSGRLWLWRQA